MNKCGAYFSRLFQAFLPLLCGICRLPIGNGKNRSICQYCIEVLPAFPSICCLCSTPWSGPGEFCRNCTETPPPWNRLTCGWPYESPIDKLIVNLKFRKQFVNARILGEAFCDRLSQCRQEESWPELLIPVPLSRKRLKKRGYNQALEITKVISEILKIPYDFTAIHRIRHTPAQSELAAKDREKNLINAFAADPKLKGKSLVLIDDVMTTGFTLRAICVALQAVGVDQIEVWCCARVLHRV